MGTAKKKGMKFKVSDAKSVRSRNKRAKRIGPTKKSRKANRG